MKPAKGLVIVNTGNGKGKTTAALGLVLRAWGNGLKVAVIQFVKSPGRGTGEQKALTRMGIEMLTVGAGFVFDPEDTGRHRELAIQQWENAKERIKSSAYDMIVLDEITYPLQFGWISVEEMLGVLKARPSSLHVVVTGRNAPQPLIEFADTVVEITDVKHHFRQGVKSQKGIEL